MRIKDYLSILIIIVLTIETLFGQSKGKILFENNCSSCHGIENGSFGPKLGGVADVRLIPDIKKFIKNPIPFILKGDERTLLLLDKYKTEMPSFKHLKNKEIRSIVNFIIEETDRLEVNALSTSDISKEELNKRYAPAIKSSDLYIELEDYVQIPRTTEHLVDKGISTLRAAKHGLFIADQMGKMYSISKGKAEVYFDLRANTPDFIFTPSIGAGLASFDFHPNFQENGLMYTTHNEIFEGKSAINEGDWPDSLGTEQQWVIDEWYTDEPNRFPFKIKSKREVLRINTPTFAHAGQDLKFRPNIDKNHSDYGLLFFGHGDGGTANLGLPQFSHHIHSALGSILRIDPQGTNGVLSSYGIPVDNPFAKHSDPTIQKEIYAFGFRNPYRFCWNGDDMYVADIGEAAVEELNVVVSGGDYGWANQEGIYGKDVAKDKTLMLERADFGVNETILPVITYDHTDGNAISGGAVYKGEIELLKGKYVFGDIVKGKVFYTDPNYFQDGIYELKIRRDNEPTSIEELVGVNRTHLRIGYDEINHDIYFMTKPDNMLRKVVMAIQK
jgi:glucose/arabinose dehydrogenase